MIEATRRNRWQPLWAVVLLWPALLQGQQVQNAAGRPLTLEEALRIARATSEQVQIAQAGVQRARGEEYRARSERYPQLSGDLSYIRTLKNGVRIGERGHG